VLPGVSAAVMNGPDRGLASSGSMRRAAPGAGAALALGQRLEPGRAVLACWVLEPDQWCRRCGCEGLVRDTVIRQLAHEPLG
jgi:hypothetical protein